MIRSNPGLPFPVSPVRLSQPSFAEAPPYSSERLEIDRPAAIHYYQPWSRDSKETDLITSKTVNAETAPIVWQLICSGVFDSRSLIIRRASPLCMRLSEETVVPMLRS